MCYFTIRRINLLFWIYPDENNLIFLYGRKQQIDFK
jgi:hypothetical protein